MPDVKGKPRETIVTTIRFTDGELGWDVFTEREPHKRLFRRLWGDPKRVRGIGETWEVPLAKLKITKPRERVLSDDQRAAIAERFRKAREAGVEIDEDEDPGETK